MSAENPFVHLHVHTEYSLLDGLSKINKIVDRAKELGMPALAITDHGTMFGVIDFYRACKKADIKPIIGMEGYLATRTMRDKDPKHDSKPYHLLMLAQNNQGYSNLLKIASAAQLEGYYYRPRIDRPFLEAHKDGLITTSGCLAAEIPQFIMAGQHDKARARIDEYLQIFGRDHFYLELQNHDIEDLRQVNAWLIETAKKDNVRLVATADVHYVLESDYDAHDTLLCIQSSALKTDENRLKMSDNSYFLIHQQKMWEWFGHINDGEALKNTLAVAEMCDIDLERKGYHLPVFPVPAGFTETEYLRHLCEKGLRWRYGDRVDTDPKLRERLAYELGVIDKMGFNTYFLIVWDLCEFARHADIWWNVRGSGAGSVAAYSLGITNIDPIQNNLLFERFLNPGRVSMPDIDMDFPDDRRAELISYAVRKYGEDKVAAIITFGTLGAKAAVRDVGRALNLDLSIVNEAARLIPTEPKPKPVHQYVEDNPELKALYDKNPEIRAVIDTAAKLQGVSRHASTHAAGVIIADKPLYEYLPLHRQTKGGDKTERDEDEGEGDAISLKLVTQFPMETCESIGLLKVDFLGLSTLTIMRRACDLIFKHHGEKYTMDNIPYRPTGDPEKDRMLRETFEMIGRGETVGVFQVESTGMQQMLREMRPTKFEHIIAAVSLYRPGPMDYIPTFNARMHGREVVNYHHPKLEAILGETYGICLAGDSLITDVETGKRYRIDQLDSLAGNFCVQAIDENLQPTVSRITHWFDNGEKPVYRLKLWNGSEIKATADHQFLTENGWKRLADLHNGDYLATPLSLLEPKHPGSEDRRKLRVLAYLIGDGSLASGASVDFVSKDLALIDEYLRCLSAFEDVTPVFTRQIHDVLRIGIRHVKGRYETSLLAWCRELGLKRRANEYLRKPKSEHGGLRSQDIHIPEFVFSLNNDDLAFFLASLWDCDGYMSQKLCHYKTISNELAHDIQTLLLRFGIRSVIIENDYTSVRGERTSYQVTVYETRKLRLILQQHMVTEKRGVICESVSTSTIKRADFVAEIESMTSLSKRKLMEQYGIDRQHFVPKRLKDERISVHVVQNAAAAVPLPQTLARTSVNWEQIVSIEPAGTTRVFDITVEGTHCFIANNIITHNCVYQEQIMQIAAEMFGYPLGEADLMRRAVSKKKKEDLLKHKEIFKQRGPQVDPTITVEVAEKIFDDIEFFANYGFNKCLVGSTEIIDVATGRIVTIDNLMSGAAKLTNTVSLNTDTLKLESRPITRVMHNGVKPVYRLTTQLGRQIDATDNHPFYTFEGWRNLGELKVDDRIAVPSRIPVEGQNIWADHKLITLGHLLAEGNLCHTSGVYYYTTDDAQLADYVRHIEQFTNTQAVVSRHHNAYSVYTKRTDRSEPTEIVTWIQELGLWGKDSYTKYIPDEVFTLTNRCIALLISRMWEGDGHINTKNRSLFYATSSIRMARQFQHLLLRMGIISKLRKVNFAYNDGRIGYQVFITGNNNLRAFRDHVAPHFVSDERRAKLDSLTLDTPQSLSAKDVIPMGVKSLIRTAQEKSGIWWHDVHAQTGIDTREFSPTSNPTKSGFARETIARLGEFFNADDLCAHAQSDIYWDKVVSIEYMGEQPTYDLTIPDTHNFIANDIIVHNSHAADYAVITVQTAFLKAHYTAEYMAALLSVYYDAPDKMAVLLDECRRLNIPLLPPSINYSSLDFDIQRDEHNKPGIRFGLAAVKNAGIGALTPIIHERETHGIFTDLENFCQRVDLRPVGKRTIESLIKVGAFDSMGTRTQLLAALDRIVSYSADHHKAKEIGQASLFGDTLSMSDELLKNLPNVEPPTHRETLDWEKELLGIYVSEHPIDAMMDALRHMNITTSDVIKSADPTMNNTPIRFVGLVSGMRKMPTKNKDMMCIAALEDRFGTIDGVMFPRIWNKFHEMLVEGGVYLFMGKLDLSRGNPQIIIEDITQQLEAIYSDSAAPNFDDNQPSWLKYDENHSGGGSSPAMRAAAQTVERAFNAPMSSLALPPEEPPSPPDMDYDSHILDTTLPDDPPEWAVDPNWQPYDQETDTQKRQPRMLTIRFHRGTNENRRYAKLVAEVKSFPGIDSFEIILVENGEDTHLVEFPDKTDYCPALIEKLRKISGVEIVEHNNGD